VPRAAIGWRGVAERVMVVGVGIGRANETVARATWLPKKPEPAVRRRGPGGPAGQYKPVRRTLFNMALRDCATRRATLPGTTPEGAHWTVSGEGGAVSLWTCGA